MERLWTTGRGSARFHCEPTNEQIIRAWVRDGIIPAHRKPGGRKFTFLRHEIFDWLISNRYEADDG